MSFAWPFALAALLAVPILAGAYVWQLRRRRRQVVRYSSVAVIRAAAPPNAGWRRHAPVALMLAALAVLGLAAARPQVSAQVPVASSGVILAIDVSGSMCSTDVAPNRLAAAQEAVRQFVKTQDTSTRIGLVVFSGFAQVAVAPTDDHERLLQAVDSLTVGRGTTIGAAILKSIDAIAQIDPAVQPAGTDAAGADGSPNAAPSPSPTPGSAPAQPVPEIVVLLTDGANTRGITPQDAAQQAAARGVRVYPIGFGTTNPATMVCTRAQLGGSLFEGQGRGPGGFGGGARSALVVDEPALRTVADTTGGEYFAAEDAGQLQGVLQDLPRHVQVVTQDVEISVVFAALAVLLVLAAAWAASRWSAFPSY
ncbi:MAG: vWA domain-containing protein [Dermatophilaceae bacterium]